jgi:hypothetical protein
LALPKNKKCLVGAMRVAGWGGNTVAPGKPKAGASFSFAATAILKEARKEDSEKSVMAALADAQAQNAQMKELLERFAAQNAGQDATQDEAQDGQPEAE